MRNPTEFQNANHTHVDLAWADIGTIARQAEVAVNWANPLLLLDTGAYLEMYIQGWVSDKAFTDWIQTEGIDGRGFTDNTVRIMKEQNDGSLTVDMGQINVPNTLITNWVRANCEWPTLDETFRLWNRGLIDDSAANLFMQVMGYADGPTRRKLAELRYEIPPTSDLLRWVVREAFDPKTIERFGYLNEFPHLVLPYAAANGLGGKTGIQYPASKDENGNNIPAHEAKWAEMEWVAHWVLPSVGQGYEMLHRLYNKSRFGPSPQSDKDTEFDIDTLKLLLKTADIPPFWRDRLIAISYLPLTRVDIRRMYQMKILNSQEVYHAYRANGYDDTNAWRLTRFTQEQALASEDKSLAKKAIKAICKSYHIGLITKQDAITRVADFTDNFMEAEEVINSCHLEFMQRQTENAIKVLKKRFILGQITIDDALNGLTRLGIVLERRGIIVDSWVMEQDARRIEATTSQLLQWYKTGIVTSQEALARLVNLGHSRSDATRMLLLIEQQLTIQKVKAIESEAKKVQGLIDKRTRLIKEQTAQAKRLKAERIALEKQGAKDHREAIAQMVKGVSTKNLKSWFANKLLNINEVRAYLLLMGWTTQVIDLWITELEKEVAAKLVAPVMEGKPKPAIEG